MEDYKEVLPIKIGDKAPLFILKNQSNQEIALKDYKGKKNVLLIFYPGDNTPGCKKQLCAIRDDFSKFEKLDTIVFGINHADDKSHQKFIDKNSFSFDLLIDTDYKVSTKYKALRIILGYKSIKRSVVLIDKEGKIVFLKRGMPTDKEILETLK
jgi:thioredoxin-dependent peroxiredoxin